MTFIPASIAGESVPKTVDKVLDSAAAFEKGSLLLVDAQGEFAECGADPAAIAAVSIGACGADTAGFNITGRKEFPAARMQGYWVGGGQLFKARYVGTLGVIGTNYGVVRDTDTLWKVDFAETVNTRVTLQGILNVAPELQPFVLVTFLPANVTPL